MGRHYEDENKIDDGMKAYQNFLTIIPRHEKAQKPLDFLRSKKAVVTNNWSICSDLHSGGYSKEGGGNIQKIFSVLTKLKIIK